MKQTEATSKKLPAADPAPAANTLSTGKMLKDPDEERKRKNRLLVVILILAGLAIGAIVWLIVYMKSDTGWREITVKGSGEPDCSSFFTFYYKMDSLERGNDYSAVSAAYTEGVRRLFKIFDITQAHEGIRGIYDVNAAPGEAVAVEPELYKAFSLMEKNGGRWLYLAPVYAVYNELFFSSDDVIAAQFDPARNEETAACFAELMPYLSDPAHVRLELLGNDTVRLVLSDEYKAYAAENNITEFIDFYWMADAFWMDILAESIIATGYTHGYIVSREGWVRCLDSSEEEYAYIVTNRQDRTVTAAAQMLYTGPVQIVALHDWTEEETYADYYFAWPDGSFATAYIDPADGYYKSAYHDLILYSRSASCAELLLAAAGMMIDDSSDPILPERLDKEGIWAVFCEGEVLTAYGDARFVRPE